MKTLSSWIQWSDYLLNVKTLYWECSLRYSTVSYLTFPLGQILMSKHYNGNVQLDTVVTVNEDKNSESVNLIRCSARSYVIVLNEIKLNQIKTQKE